MLRWLITQSGESHTPSASAASAVSTCGGGTRLSCLWYQLSEAPSLTSTRVNHLMVRPPMWPGRMTRTGNPWSGGSQRPFIL